MTPSEWDRVAQLFAELRGADDAARRRQLGVDDDGSADPVIVEVRRLLRHHDNATAAFLEAPCPDLAGKLERHVADELVRITTGDPVDSENDRLVGERIGAYTIERLLASGGMGAVYLARQSNPSRRVALKLMRHGLGSRAALRRFETESEILGRMQHPGIAQVYEAGTHRDRDAGVPFFAMEYVEGGRPITDFANHRKLGTRERIQLFVTVCEAVHHGHVKGVVHRDLKPTNILVDAAGRTKVIDFGVARATDVDIAATTLRTDIGQLIGTPRYMSPEQCDADPARIDARCDVYSLGVVLYELLCGRLPYASEGKPTHDLIRSIREDPPTRLGSHSSRLRGDVETIVMKALEKAPERRYASAQALADDLERYLRGEAIQARPPSAIYQLRSIARRHRAIFAATTTILATLLAGSVAVSALLVRESGARRTAEDALRERDAALEASKRSLARVQSTHAFLQRLLGTADPQQGGREGTLVVDAMEFGLVELEAGLLSDQPDARIELLRTIAAAIANNGRPQRGEEIVRRALTEAKALGVEGRALQSRCLNDLGILLSHLGDSDGALAALQEAALLAEEDTPAGSAALADTLYRLAMVHHTADRESLAVDALIRAEHMTSVHGFPSDTFALQCAMLRASIQLRQGDLRAAIGTLEAARDALPAVLRTRPATLGSLATALGDAYEHNGDLALAEASYRESVEKADEISAGDHPNRAGARIGHARLLRVLGRPQEAFETADAALTMARRIYGSAPVDAIAKSLGQRGHSLLALGRVAEAEADLSEALAAERKLHPEDHPDVAVALDRLGESLIAQGRFEALLPLIEESIALRRRLYKGDHPEICAGLNNYSFVLRTVGRWDEARVAIDDCIAMQRRIFQGDNPDLAFALNSRGTILLLSGHPIDAIPQFEEALGMRERIFKDAHPAIATSLNDLGNASLSANRPAEAVKHLARSAEMWRALLGPEHPDVSLTRSNLARARLSAGDMAGALGDIQEAIAAEEAAGETRSSSGYVALTAAMIFMANGDLGVAQPQVDRAIAIFSATTEKGSQPLARSLAVKARIESRLGHAEEARDLLVKARTMAESVEPAGGPARRYVEEIEREMAVGTLR